MLTRASGRRGVGAAGPRVSGDLLAGAQSGKGIVLDLARAHGLSLVVALVFFTELGVPSFIPNEVPLLLIGAYDLHSLLGLMGAIAAVSAADLLGTTGLFLLIRSGGGRVVVRVLQGHAGERAVARATRSSARPRCRAGHGQPPAAAGAQPGRRPGKTAPTRRRS